MRKGKAFRFIPALLDDVNHVMSLRDPRQMYIEVGIEAVTMACNVYRLIVAHNNAKKYEKLMRRLEEQYQGIDGLQINNGEDNIGTQIYAQYERVKQDVELGLFSKAEVRKFVSLEQKTLNILEEELSLLEVSPEDVYWDQLQEVYRYTLRKKAQLLKIYLMEDN